MKRAKIFAAVIYAMLVMGTITFVHFPELQADEAQAKIGAEQARETALRAVPGTVKESDLETEHGRLIYSFEIKRPGQRGITEVNVSAMDGSIVDIHREHAGKSRKAEQHAQLNAESSNHGDNL
jgi:Peptidase propeptide and YPEB domain